jgi:hypothetical protein
MTSCCCWVLYRWWLGRPLVYRCFLHQPHHRLDCSSFNQFAVIGNIMLSVYQSFVLFVNMPVIEYKYNIFNCLFNYNALLSDDVLLMAGSTTSVLMCFVRIPNRNSDALLHNNNIRFRRLSHYQGSRELHHNLWCPELLHRRPEL